MLKSIAEKSSPAYAKMEPDGDQATAVTQPPQENWW